MRHDIFDMRNKESIKCNNNNIKGNLRRTHFMKPIIIMLCE